MPAPEYDPMALAMVIKNQSKRINELNSEIEHLRKSLLRREGEIVDLEKRIAELEAENAELRKRTTCTFTVSVREPFSLPEED